jgi:hypothetical protein
MRVNFEMSEAQVSSLRQLQERTGASSLKDLINQALSVLEWAANEAAHGNEIAAVSEDGNSYRVLVTPLLQHVAKAEYAAPAPMTERKRSAGRP